MNFSNITKTGSDKDMAVELKIDPKQISFRPNKQSIVLWRRLLLLRYFIKLGESDDINVNWTDYDIKCKKILLNYVREEFQPVVPKDLYKSVTQFFCERQEKHNYHNILYNF